MATKRPAIKTNWANDKFTTTSWSIVLEAAQEGTETAAPAFAELCRIYWYPLYAFLRKRGNSPADAEDLVQSFFVRLMEKNIVGRASADRGRFRWFLTSALKQFVAIHRRNHRASIRCPDKPLVSLSDGGAEARYVLESRRDLLPDELLDRAWALSVIERTLDRLRNESEEAGKGQRFHCLRGFLTGQRDHSGREVAQQLGISEGAVRVAVYRLKHRFAQLLREEVRQTLQNPADVDDELAKLFAALAQ